MLANLIQRAVGAPLRLLACSSLVLALAACGGGGGSPGSTGNTPPPGTPDVPVVPPVVPPIPQPGLTIALTNGAGTPIASLSGGQSAIVKATLLNAAGTPAAGQIVNFTQNGNLVAFTPSSASALTDATGVAVVTVKPSSVTAAGATGITATAVVDLKTATASINLSIGAAPLTVGALSFAPPPTGPVPAFSTISLQIPVTSGGAAAANSLGLTLSSLCTGDGAATIVLGPFNAGVQMATYTNNGCTRVNDLITAAIGSSVQSIALGVGSASIGTIQFVSSDLPGSSIVLKGSGGLGRKESALLTFRVLDQNNNGLAGVDVDFSASTITGGLSLAPLKGTTDAAGNVSTTVSSGTIPTPVRIFAQATRNGKVISGLSDTLTISTGLPIQKSMSLSVDSYNIEGWGIDGTVANVTVRLADQYGNPISNDTAVTFVTEGGAIGTPERGACVTLDGGCTVPLKSQNFRPTNGRVTVLAYVQGLEDFVDANGDGQFTCSAWHPPGEPGNVSPIPYRPLIDVCTGTRESFTDLGDPFLDAGLLGSVFGFEKVQKYGTLDGVYQFANGDLPFPYNHASYTSTGNGAWGLNYIRATAEIVFSGSEPTLVRQICPGGVCRDWVSSDGDDRVIVGLSGAGCTAKDLRFRLYDVNNNPLPHKTTVGIADTTKVVPGTVSPNIVPSTNSIGGTVHTVVIKPGQLCEADTPSVRVTTPGGTSYTFGFSTAPQT